MTLMKPTIRSVVLVALLSIFPALAEPKPVAAEIAEAAPAPKPAWIFESRQAQIPAPALPPGAKKHRSAIELHQRFLPIAASPDAVFFTSATDHRIVCLEAASGKKRWELTTGAPVQMAPSYANGKVFAGSDDGVVYCIDAKTGNVVWKLPPPHPRCMISFGRVVSAWPVRTSIRVKDGVAYYGSGVFPHDGTFITAVDATSGKRIWQNAATGESPFDWVALSPLGYMGMSDGLLTVNCYGKGVKRFQMKDGQPPKGRFKGRAGPIRHPMTASAGAYKFKSGRTGTIQAFGPGKGGTIKEPIVADPFGDKAAGQAAKSILEKTGVTAGYALVMDGRNGALAAALASASQLQVQIVFDDETRMLTARKELQKTGLYGETIVARHVPKGTPLPFPSSIFDLVVSEAAVQDGALPSDVAEMERVLQPIRGVIRIGGKAAKADLDAWAATTKLTGWESDGTWTQRTRPRLENAGGWTHQYADPGNTACSDDAVLKGPLGVVWYGNPDAADMRNRDGIAALISDGTLISPGANSLEGYDQYTGRWLWRREMRNLSRAAGGAGNLAANSNSLFVIHNNMVLDIDLRTGKTKRKFGGGWGWIACDNDTLWGSVGNWGGSTGLFAYDLRTGKKLWKFPNDDNKYGFFNATICVGDGLIYFINNGANPGLVKQSNDEMLAYLPKLPANEQKRVAQEIKKNARDVRLLMALDARTGELQWFRGIDVSDCGGGAKSYITVKKKKRKYSVAMAYKNGVLLHYNASAGGKLWGNWASKNWDWRGVAARSAKDGTLMWFHQVGFRGRIVVIDDVVHAEPWALKLKTGDFITRKHPITGTDSRWTWCRFGKQCGIYNASTNFLFGRSAGVGYHDVGRDRGLYTFMLSRSSCWFDTVSGGGVMVKPPQSFGCTCSVSLPFTFALAQVPTEPATPQVYSAWGPPLPVKHLNVDFGATGDRHDKTGNLWLAANIFRSTSRIPMLKFRMGQTFYPGGGQRAESGTFAKVEGTDAPFLFASRSHGLQAARIPVLRPQDGQGVFTVRLGFAASASDKPGQRVFEVKLQGKTVLKKLDIVADAGGANKALWKEFTGIKTGEILTIELVAASDTPTDEFMPILCAAQIRRSDTAQ